MKVTLDDAQLHNTEVENHALFHILMKEGPPHPIATRKRSNSPHALRSSTPPAPPLTLSILMADTGEASHTAQTSTDANLRQRHPQYQGTPPTAPPSQPPPPRPERQQQNQTSTTTKAIVGAVSLGVVTAAVGGTYLLADNEAFFPVAVAACVATFSTVVLRFAFGGNNGVGNGRPRVRHIRHHRHFTGERAAYVRTSQRLAMMDRDFTDADYELLLDLDNNSQRLRRFLEGASHETVSRLPTLIFRDPPRRAAENEEKDSMSGGAPSKEGMAAEGNPGNMADTLGLVEPGEVDDLKAEKSANAEGDTKLQDITAHDSEFAGATARRCTICLEDFEDGMKIRILPCFHRFMAECIDPWLTQQARCPVCKYSIQEGMNSMPPGMS